MQYLLLFPPKHVDSEGGRHVQGLQLLQPLHAGPGRFPAVRGHLEEVQQGLPAADGEGLLHRQDLQIVKALIGDVLLRVGVGPLIEDLLELPEVPGRRDHIEEHPAGPQHPPDTIRNTPELRECIKDAMLREGVASAADLNRLIGYDSVHTLERLLSGKLNWFPDILSAVAEALGIDHDSLPISPAERMQLLPAGYFGDGAMLVRPIPVVSWANAAGHLDLLANPDTRLFSRWDPENTETVPAPVGTRKGTQAFRVTGISMEPTIMDDDIILVEQRMSLDEVPNNKIVVARLTEGKFEDCVVCKRLRRQGGHCWLTSDNPAGMVIPVEPSDLQWLGIVVRKQSEL